MRHGGLEQRLVGVDTINLRSCRDDLEARQAYLEIERVFDHVMAFNCFNEVYLQWGRKVVFSDHPRHSLVDPGSQ